MPCSNEDHEHTWPDKGELVIEKCERMCAYCKGPYREHEWKYAWFLRRHVRTVHCHELGTHPELTVSDGW